MKRITATDLQRRLQYEVDRAGSQANLARTIGATEPMVSLALHRGILNKHLVAALGYRKVVLYERIMK